jgi:hypothetical protein
MEVRNSESGETLFFLFFPFLAKPISLTSVLELLLQLQCKS